jgi:hypothetical protein
MKTHPGDIKMAFEKLIHTGAIIEKLIIDCAELKAALQKWKISRKELKMN